LKYRIPQIYLEVQLRKKLNDKIDDFYFPNVNFPLKTFQQHLHMEYIYLSWCDIPELESFMIGKMTTDMFRSVSCNHNPFFASFMTYTVFVTRVTQWMPLVEQECLAILEHLSSLFLWGWCCSVFSFLFNVF